MTPVALFVFNRPDLTADAMRRLAQVQPPRLLVVADGPRGDAERAACERTIAAVRDGLTWDCRLEILRSDVNLGCRRRLESGLDWVFEQAERAIILEDDVEVAASFFPYAERALDRFVGEPSMRSITARNALIESPGRDGPFRARKGSIWGWATWADRRRNYRTGFATTPSDALQDGLARHVDDALLRRLQQHLLRTRLWEQIDTWDMQWNLWNVATGGWSLIPPRNLSRNHGLGPGATHLVLADDVRGAYPLYDWRWHEPPEAERALPGIDEGYDRAFTILEIILNYGEPRRWRVLSRRRGARRGGNDEGWNLMFEPFDHASETRALIAHLRALVPHPQLDGLAEAFASSSPEARDGS